MSKRVTLTGGWRLFWFGMLWFPMQGYGLGLWESYQLALENDPAYQRQLNLFRASGERVPQAKAALLPQISGVATHSRGHLEVDTPSDPVPDRRGSAPGGRRDVSISSFNLEAASVPLEDNYDNSQLSLKFSQNIFDRSRWLSLKSARSIADEARLELHDARRLLVLETARAYYDLLSAQDALKVARLELKAVERQRDFAERRYEEDIGTLTDVHEARARVELARIDKINAQNNSSIAENRLGKLTGDPVGHVLRLPETFEPPPLHPAAESHWVKLAVNNSIDVRLARQQVQSAELEVKRQQSGHWPTLSLVAESTYERAGVSTVSTGEDRFRNQISLQFRVPIFSGFALRSRVREAHYKKHAADLGLTNARAELSRDVRSAYDSVRSSRRRVETFKLAYNQSLSALELRERGYLEGLSSNLELLDAVRDTYRARRQWLQSRYQYLIDLLRLHSLCNIMDDELIRMLDAYLTGRSG